MANTTFVDGTTPIVASWLNDVNRLTYTGQFPSGSSFNATAVPYTPPGTGAVATTVSKKLRETISVLDFGADPTGAADSTSAIQAAILAAAGKCLKIPAGTYTVSAELDVTSSMSIYGDGWGQSILSTTSATAHLLKVTAGFCDINGLQFTSSVSRTAGAYVYYGAGNQLLRNFYMSGAFYGVYSYQATTVKITDFSIWNTQGSGVAIYFTGGAGSNDLYISRGTISGPSVLTANGIQIDNAGAVNITDCDVIRHNSCLKINPQNGVIVSYVYVENSYFDTANTGIDLSPAAGGTIQGVRFVGCWASAHTGTGVSIGGAGSIVGAEFIGLHCFSNGSNGITISNAAAADVHFVGGAICGNTGHGASIGANVSSWGFNGTRIGNGYGKTGNTLFGINVAAGTSGYLTIIGCDLTGNTSGALNDLGTGGNKNVYGNVPLDPGSTGSITVTASPFTYTAGDRPETIYIDQGTVNLVTVDGVGVFQSTHCTVRLGAGKSCVVTYTGAPFMNKTIE